MKFINSKKGVSPLIATVLLIAFAVALGAVVMNWGRGYIEQTQTLAADQSDALIICSTKIDLDLIEIDYEKQACFNASGNGGDGTVQLILENRGTYGLEKIQFRAITDGSNVPVSQTENSSIGDSVLGPGEAGYFEINLTGDNTDATKVKQVAITPVVSVSGNEVACTGNQLVYSGLSGGLGDCADIMD